MAQLKKLASTSNNAKEDDTRESQATVPALMQQTIRCECGAQILLVPDLKAMSQAIELHLNEHQKKGCDVEAEAEVERIRDDLIKQTLTKAAKTATEQSDKNTSKV